MRRPYESNRLCLSQHGWTDDGRRESGGAATEAAPPRERGPLVGFPWVAAGSFGLNDSQHVSRRIEEAVVRDPIPRLLVVAIDRNLGVDLGLVVESPASRAEHRVNQQGASLGLVEGHADLVRSEPAVERNPSTKAIQKARLSVGGVKEGGATLQLVYWESRGEFVTVLVTVRSRSRLRCDGWSVRNQLNCPKTRSISRACEIKAGHSSVTAEDRYASLHADRDP